MDGVAGPAVWRDLLRARARGEHNPNGYTYALASKGSPETLTVCGETPVTVGQSDLNPPQAARIATTTSVPATESLWIMIDSKLGEEERVRGAGLKRS